MKHYGDYAASSIRMVEDEKLKGLLKDLFSKEEIDVVIETGTFDGLGSSTMLAQAFEDRRPPRHFYTCELNYSKHRRARKNLAQYPFITCLWGRTVRLEEAIPFIQNDDAILNHEKYPDVYIDGLEDRVSMYINECKGGFHSKRKAFIRAIDPVYNFRRWQWYQGEDLLRKLVSKHQDEKPFILLDSAGGIGLLEFNIVQEVMQDKPYWLLLDDVHHLKHFRSLEKVKNDPSFTLLNDDAANGWALAKHNID